MLLSMTSGSEGCLSRGGAPSCLQDVPFPSPNAVCLGSAGLRHPVWFCLRMGSGSEMLFQPFRSKGK